MVTVIDTNVIFQGLDSSKGASYFILELLKDRKINLALSYQVITEYEEVLKRKTTLERLRLDTNDIDDILAYLAYISFPYEPTYVLRPNLRDEKDNIFIELAFVSNAEYLITSNIKDFTKNNELKFDNFTVITPGEFVVQWRTKNEN